MRWILLAAGIVAIIGLTGMNVYSLYQIRDNTVESFEEAKQLQITEFADRIRWNFIRPFTRLASLDLEMVDETFDRTGEFPKKAREVLEKASKDSIFSAIYFTPDNSNVCAEENPTLLKFNPETSQFEESMDDSGIVCDGVGMARTRMKVLMEEYRYNNKVIFDTHRSMTLALINLNNREVFGYLTMPVNQQYLAESYLQPKLEEKFGNPEESGIAVWIRDWTQDDIIAQSNSEVEYNNREINLRQRFSDFFDDWRLEANFTEESAVAAGNASLIKNLVVLIAAFILLSGALVFMFITAQRERALAQRQAGFLANVTHELKTPLAVMQAAGENLADGRVDDQKRLQSYGNHIYTEAIRLRKMIEKLLDVARADAGDALIEPQIVQLDKPVQQYIEEHQSYIQNKGFTLETSISEDLPPTKIDLESFEAIIGNLVENAIKYSRDKKYIHISLFQENGEIILQIEDKGSGISKKSLKHIFEKFYRAEDTLTAKTKGHGLGLSIVKNLVELNGGSIEVESEEGKGSTFTVSLPVIEEKIPGDTPEPEFNTESHQNMQLT